MTPSLFALVDCNNFYASCERLFRPDLRLKPIVILSNNDGCIISRSNEAKALGVAMGAPFYQIERELRRLGVSVFSSNYALYGELSRRVMETLEDWTPDLEVYSIDEAFLDLGTGPAGDRVQQALQMRGRLLQEVGMPCSIGLAPSKTLAKLANRSAKQRPDGIFDARCPQVQARLLRDSPIEAVWGVGRRLGVKLKAFGLNTAHDLARSDSDWIRQHFSVTLQRTVLELRGQSHIELEALTDRKMILSSRSFRQPVHTLEELRQILALYAARAASKLRRQSQRPYCCTVAVSIRTGVHASARQPYGAQAFVPLTTPTQDTRDISAATLQALQQIYRPGYAYAKASVQLLDLLGPGEFQYGLFDAPTQRPRSAALMGLLDQLNRDGRTRLGFASALGPHGGGRQAARSPAYLSDWGQLWPVRAG
ncbi:MAG: DNA polymerase V subunit UmuC [Pseudomonadota bacterium]